MEVTFSDYTPPKTSVPSLSFDIESAPGDTYIIRYQSALSGTQEWFEWSLSGTDFIAIAQELQDSYIEASTRDPSQANRSSPTTTPPVVPQLQLGPSTPTSDNRPPSSRRASQLLALAERQLADAQETLETSQEALEVAKRALDVAKEYYSMSQGRSPPSHMVSF